MVARSTPAPAVGVGDARDPRLLARLRAATRELHASLDAAVGGDITLSRVSYARFLAASRHAVGAVEQGIAHVLGPDFQAQRAAALDADLAALARDGLVVDLAPGEPPHLSLGDEAEALGAAYVVEGSSLGGMVLTARVRAAHGPDAPVAYLSLRGDDTGARWRWFKGELARFAARHPDDATFDRAAAAARATFDVYARAFEAFTPPARTRATT